MALHHTEFAKLPATDAVVDVINTSDPVARLRIVNSTNPADPVNVTDLVVMPLNAVPFEAADENGFAEANSIANGTVLAAAGSGMVANMFMIEVWQSVNYVILFWGSVGEAGDDPAPDMIINNRTLIENQIIQVSSFKYRAIPQ